MHTGRRNYSTFAAKMFHIWRHYPRLLGTWYTPITCVHATRQVCRPAAKTSGKKIHDRKICWLHLCKLETCTYISLAAIYGLTAITKMLVAGWKHASFPCYSNGSTRDSPRCFIFRATGQENRTRFSKSALLKYLFYSNQVIYAHQNMVILRTH